jgi:hypothetical protein
MEEYTLVQALGICTGRTAHRGSRGIALLYRHWGFVQAVWHRKSAQL